MRELIGMKLRPDELYYFYKNAPVMSVSLHKVASNSKLWHKRIDHPSKHAVKLLDQYRTTYTRTDPKDQGATNYLCVVSANSCSCLVQKGKWCTWLTLQHVLLVENWKLQSPGNCNSTRRWGDRIRPCNSNVFIFNTTSQSAGTLFSFFVV